MQMYEGPALHKTHSTSYVTYLVIHLAIGRKLADFCMERLILSAPDLTTPDKSDETGSGENVEVI